MEEISMAILNHDSSSFSTIAKHANSSDDTIVWLFSITGGIIMCKIAYELTGVISPLIFKRFIEVENVQKLEWNKRGFSTFHALFAVIGSLYFLIVSNLFNELGQEELIINRSSRSSKTVLGISIGYFLSDLAMIIWSYPTLGGLEYVLHHGLSMFALSQSILSGQAQFYIFMVLFTEIVIPFVNLRWYLDVAGKKNSTLYLLNAIALVAGWLVARVVLFVYFFYHMYIHFDQVKQMYPIGFYSMLTIPPALAMMNLFWFWKMAKGLIKILIKLKRA